DGVPRTGAGRPHRTVREWPAELPRRRQPGRGAGKCPHRVEPDGRRDSRRRQRSLGSSLHGDRRGPDRHLAGPPERLERQRHHRAGRDDERERCLARRAGDLLVRRHSADAARVRRGRRGRAAGRRDPEPRVHVSRCRRSSDGAVGEHPIGDRDRSGRAANAPAEQSLCALHLRRGQRRRDDDRYRSHQEPLMSVLAWVDALTRRTRARALNERGIAAVMALIVILALSLLVTAFLAVSAFEPRISQNLADSTQARYAADAGIEWAFDRLVVTTSWNTLLAGAAGCATAVTPAGWTNVAVPNVAGTFTVSLRNDCQAGDNLITGVAVDNVTGTATNDGNGILIVTATGSYQGAQKRIQAVIRRDLATNSPDFPAAVNEPGVQSD